MKAFFVLLSLCCGLTASATTYYVSATGSDSNNGTSTSTPWQTISKVNSMFSSLSPGDNVLFNRGDVFYGKLTISTSGTSGNPITIGSYGTGANPIITGFTTVSSWTNLGGNIWESSGAISGLPSCNMVLVSGVNSAMGRWPNTGYNTMTSTTSTSITASTLTHNWTGATAVIRALKWVIDTAKILSYSGNTINFTAHTYNPQAGWGYFIENDPSTLDTANEWYYNPSTKKIRIYSTSSPASVQVSTVDTLINAIYKNYITFSNIDFTGANGNAILLGSTKYITITGCHFTNNGNRAIFGQNYGSNSDSIKISSCIFSDNNNNAVNLPGEFIGAHFWNNTIRRTGIYPGMGTNLSYTGISLNGAGSVVEYNNVDSSGYIGIDFSGDLITVNNNYVTNFCFLKDDGGGIYTGGAHTGVKITSNIVVDGLNAGVGTNSPTAPETAGIYCDDGSAGITVMNNSVFNIYGQGIYFHNASSDNCLNNLTYNCQYGLLINNDDGGYTTTGMVVKHNQFIAKTYYGAEFTTTKQYAAHYATWKTSGTPFTDFGVIDSNYYARPINDDSTVAVTVFSVADYYYNLAGWRALSSQDSHTNKSPVSISDTSQLASFYNQTNSSISASIPAGSWVDVKNNSYSGSTTLEPYAGLVLIQTSATPVANAGGDGTLTLPTNSVYLSGTGSVSGGTITAYHWTTVSGPSSGTIETPDSAATNIDDLIYGVYQFQLEVTDNHGATALDTVQIRVVTKPVVNAGGDGTLTLPTNSVYLSGTASVAGGTITAYHWTTVAGPSSGTIETPDSAATNIDDLIYGVYQFQLEVTDNHGATALDTVQIRVVNSPSGYNTDQSNISASPISLSVYPNPFESFIKVSINDDFYGKYVLIITDAAGRKVLMRSGTKGTKYLEESINTSNLQKGVYILQFQQNGYSSIIKILK